MSEWDAIPSIDCVDEHLQDSFDFYSVRVPGVGRRVAREDLSKLVWSVTRAAVSQSRCDKLSEADLYLTISQCERVIREIEMQECDKFLTAAESFLKKNKEQGGRIASPEVAKHRQPHQPKDQTTLRIWNFLCDFCRQPQLIASSESREAPASHTSAEKSSSPPPPPPEH
mmetsp:Transcript_38758/g.124238  ORF Transcript_38758/g.124238 Transcript_38758/m.124238 type:complete len:170 (+) Transcript_38758:62-571(+)|eukprot:CAMPEP_0118912952 /NCGR_PEP_ID=MMETSP1166-20130328/13975_1 /TAXON_ID=1104430 /ORGANISM="Chrysoreinhardia sp, Strain CCMP3193" /LENGTH=169 /DNA_ID=CAMNT_0006852483 /DNA_START=32 /DNA_END=541 /DNA_ORIENTATION=+